MRLSWVGAAALVAGCSAAPAVDTAQAPGDAAPPTVASVTPVAPSGAPRTLVEGLEVPWAIAFLPGGDALVTERDTARLMRVTAAGQAGEVGRIDGVSPAGEGGLLGVAVSPTFDKDHYVFVYFTAEADNRIVRYAYDQRLSDPVTIVQGIPKGGNHNGGRLAFGPDGFLYAATGEVGDRGLSQEKESLGGKILRMDMQGAPAPENPFGTLVWSMGHRNVQGLAWDDAGNMYAAEFGQNTYDEINLIKPGGNYGWPEVEGVSDDNLYINPIVTWSTDEASPSGLAYADGSLWAAALRGQRLWQVPVTDQGTAGKPVARYVDEFGRMRAVATAPDGPLWASTSNLDGRGDPRPGDDRILIVPTR
ncbi:oxidoreductase [Acrocarpospora phusangensis]|uniref:Oxidoreductase n=1 Tax=Acrocarpospora phusangensis TaxID=1070424 RepID=A0A919USS5_9ACTN|nr:PQQ-dependent sugar dehydrogenase [Acrocarpospora phusangensis]GIH29552.1 oxidoreductase [Acrocarpospora phusangensis]